MVEYRSEQGVFKVTKWGVRCDVQVVGNYYDLGDRSHLIIIHLQLSDHHHHHHRGIVVLHRRRVTLIVVVITRGDEALEAPRLERERERESYTAGKRERDRQWRQKERRGGQGGREGGVILIPKKSINQIHVATGLLMV